jgi:hypothetical protein
MAAEASVSRTIWVTTITAVITSLVGLGFAYVHYRLGIGPGGNPIKTGTEGAPEKPPASTAPRPDARGRVVKDALDTLTAVAADLQKVPAAERPQRRYLTLTHLHNARRLSAADLRAFRQTLVQLAEHLSPPGRVVAFNAIDAEQTIYAVDLKELGWDAEPAWRQILKVYPYGLTYEDAANAQLRAADQQVQTLSGSKLPYVRADWFAAALVRPPLVGAEGLLKTPTREVPPSVRALAQTYDQEELNLEAAAADLNLADPKRLGDLVREEPRLRRTLGLEPLTQGGIIRRSVWESMKFTTSPFQEVSRELNLGTPIRVQ